MVEKSQLLSAEYRLRFEKMEQYRNGVWKILCSRFFSQYIPEESAVLDLGAGWGEFINNVKANSKFAMDLNADTKEHLNDGITLIHQDCSEPWQLDSESLDVVFTSNFLEHLPNKERVDHTIAEAYRCLKKGGRIICLGPNIKYVNGAYWDFWDHYIPLTDASVEELLKLAGFNVRENIPRFLPYSMSNEKNPPLFTVSLYLKMPFIWPLLGKQFLVVAEKI